MSLNRSWPSAAITALAIASFASAQQGIDEALHADAHGPAPSAPPRHVIPLGQQQALIPATGETIDMPTEEVWKPICWNTAALSVEELKAMAEAHTAEMCIEEDIFVLGGGVADRAGLNVVFALGASVPAAAVPAFAAAEAYIESQFPNENITVTVSVSFAALGPGIIGGTSSAYGYVDWATSRSVLVGGMDGSDTIQSSLPSGTTIPVRYSTSSTTNETRIFWTFANWKASGGAVTGTDASMQFSTNFPFDYDPSNGVSSGTMSLQDVIIHETGHALGFGSGVDFRNRDIETLDVFRFRRTDGSSDFNPDTTAEFAVRPRWAVRNNPNNDVNFDIVGAEYALSDGSPWQASHFQEQTPAIGIMDPAINYAETFYPNFYRTSDLTAFDAIGYDR